jgi:hypothetical protein
MIETMLSNIGILRLTVKCRHWAQIPINGQDLPVNPDLRGPHSLPPRVRFQEPNETQQQRHEPAAPADPPPVIILPPTTQDPAPQRAPTLTIDTDFPTDSPHAPSAPRSRPHFFDDDDDDAPTDYIIEVIEEPLPPSLRSPQQGEQRSGRPKRATRKPDQLTYEELGEPRARYHSRPQQTISTIRLQPSSLLRVYAVNTVDALTAFLELSKRHRCNERRMAKSVPRPH